MTAKQWLEVPDDYHGGSTSRRRLRARDDDGAQLTMRQAFLGYFNARGADVHRRLVLIDKQWGSAVGNTSRGRGVKWVSAVDGQGTPVKIHFTSATPAEVTLVVSTLETNRVPRIHRGVLVQTVEDRRRPWV